MMTGSKISTVLIVVNIREAPFYDFFVVFSYYVILERVNLHRLSIYILN